MAARNIGGDELALTVSESFSDGNLSAAFRLEGYQNPVWLPGKVRFISRALAKRVQQSGGLLEQADQDMQEDRWREPTAAVIIPPDSLEAQLRAQYEAEKQIRVMCTSGFTDGMLNAEFSAIDRPPEIGLNEILTLPVSLLEKCISSGAEFTNDSAEMEPFEGHYQIRFANQISPVMVWRQAREEKRAALEAKAQREARNAETLAQIERLTNQFLEAENAGDTRGVARLTRTLDTLYSRVQ